jgi:hypothetical protein
MRLVTTPMKQAIAKKMRANLVFAKIFITNETPWTEVQGFFRACRLRRITYASLRAPFIPRLKAWGFLAGLINNDLVKGLKTATPPPSSRQAGQARVYNYLNLLDSCFRGNEKKRICRFSRNPHKLSKGKEKVNKKILAIIIFFC